MLKSLDTGIYISPENASQKYVYVKKKSLVKGAFFLTGVATGISAVFAAVDINKAYGLNIAAYNKKSNAPTKEVLLSTGPIAPSKEVLPPMPSRTPIPPIPVLDIPVPSVPSRPPIPPVSAAKVDIYFNGRPASPEAQKIYRLLKGWHHNGGPIKKKQAVDAALMWEVCKSKGFDDNVCLLTVVTGGTESRWTRGANEGRTAAKSRRKTGNVGKCIAQITSPAVIKKYDMRDRNNFWECTVVAARYLHDIREKYSGRYNGQILNELMLAGYNAGETRAVRARKKFKITKKHIRRGMKIYKRLAPAIK